MSRARWRDVNGVLLLDKPVGCSSNQALQRARRLFSARKAGHTGSLDPLATGLLPVCFGQATKISAFLLDADKHYQVTCRFGQATDTGDREGTLTAGDGPVDVSQARLEAALADFRGELMQVPPMYSALKHQGRRLYALAREGLEVERKARPVTIRALTLLALDGSDARLDVRCSKGTYIRTLVEDIAGALGTHAHVTALRRLAVGPFDAQGLIDFDALEARAADGTEALDEVLLPADAALSDWPRVELAPESAGFLLQGQAVQIGRSLRPPVGQQVRIYARDAGFLGVGELEIDGRLAPKRLFSL